MESVPAEKKSCQNKSLVSIFLVFSSASTLFLKALTTYHNKTLDLLLGNFDLHGLVLSEFKQSIEEDTALLSLNNFSILSPSNDLLALLDNLLNDGVELVEYLINPLLVLSKLELLQGPDEVSETVLSENLNRLASQISNLFGLTKHEHGDGVVGPLEKLLSDVKRLLGLCTLGENSENLADLMAPQWPQLVDGGGVEEVVHDELPDELPVRTEGNHGNGVIISEALNGRGLEPCVEGSSLVGLKEEFEELRGGGNNGGHRPKVERVQRAITFG